MGDHGNGGGTPKRPLGAWVEGYEPPRVDVLGTLEELTRGPDGPGGDLNGLVISF